MSDKLISVEGLVKKYGKITAVDGITFEVSKGEIYGLLGPNGAGKTTTLECLEGLRKIDGGSLNVVGCNPQKDRNRLRDKMGVQLQSSFLQDNIYVSEAMSLVCAGHKVPYRGDLIKQFGLETLIKKQYHQLSTGQKRRLHLAFALVSNPSLVILDEPTAGLDVEGRVELHNEMRRLKEKNITILLATHDMAEAEKLCDCISIIKQGKIAATGSPADVANVVQKETRIAIRTTNGSIILNSDIEGAKFIGEKDDYGIWVSDDSAGAIIKLLQRVREANDTVVDLHIERPTLEESFLEIVKGGK
jgi:ABC-2 type transport system ATP-binding protein